MERIVCKVRTDRHVPDCVLYPGKQSRQTYFDRVASRLGEDRASRFKNRILKNIETES